LARALSSLSFEMPGHDACARSNGSWLNGKQIKRAKIKAGDKFQPGQPSLVLEAIEPVEI
jgi:hypothetical protein